MKHDMGETAEELVTKGNRRDPDALVDAAVIAGKLGMAKSSVYRLQASGMIPSYAVGPRLRGRRFDLAEVRAALRALALKAVTK